jgi:hypothetical protein
MRHWNMVYLDVERLPGIAKSLGDYLLSDQADHPPPALHLVAPAADAIAGP